MDALNASWLLNPRNVPVLSQSTRWSVTWHKIFHLAHIAHTGRNDKHVYWEYETVTWAANELIPSSRHPNTETWRVHAKQKLWGWKHLLSRKGDRLVGIHTLTLEKVAAVVVCGWSDVRRWISAVQPKLRYLLEAVKECTQYEHRAASSPGNTCAWSLISRLHCKGEWGVCEMISW